MSLADFGSERTERERKRAEIQKERDNAETITVTAKKPLSFGEKFNAERKKQGAGGTFNGTAKSIRPIRPMTRRVATIFLSKERSSVTKKPRPQMTTSLPATKRAAR
jgi:hypothetical protein